MPQQQSPVNRWMALIRALKTSPALLQELEECLRDYGEEEMRRLQEASVEALTDPTVKTFALSCLGRVQMCRELLSVMDFKK